MITLTNGNIQNYSGVAVPNGSISFQLNLDATVIAAPGGLIPASQVVIFQFDINGDLVQPAEIYSNAELQPQNSNGLGTYYLVSLFDANGAPLSTSPLLWQFTQPANSTVDISTMTPYFTGSTVIYYASPLTLPSGSNEDVQFNNNGVFGGNDFFQWNNTTLTLTLPNLVLGGTFTDGVGSVGTSGQVLTSTATETAWVNPVSAIQYVIDGGGSVPATGSWGQIQIPYDCTITGVTLTADQSGDAVVDILTSSYAGFPGSLVSITASDKPTLSGAQKYTDSTLTGWTTALAAGTILQVSLTSVTTVTRLNLTIKLAVKV